MVVVFVCLTAGLECLWLIDCWRFVVVFGGYACAQVWVGWLAISCCVACCLFFVFVGLDLHFSLWCLC